MKSLFIVVIILLTASSCKENTKTKVIDNTFFESLKFGLVAYYPFDESANDSSQNHLNLVPTDITYTTDRHGNSNSAIQLNGSTSYLQLNDNNLLDFGSGDFSYAFWLKRNVTGVRHDLITKKDINTPVPCTHDFALFIETNDSLIFHLREVASLYYDHATPNVKIGTDWTHIVAVRDHSALRVYIDGVLRGVGQSSTNLSSTGPLRIGANRTDPSGSNANPILVVDGKMDDIRIYNRVLTLEEIEALYDL